MAEARRDGGTGEMSAQRMGHPVSESTVDDWSRAVKWLDDAGDAGAIGHYCEPDARRLVAELIADVRAEERKRAEDELAVARKLQGDADRQRHDAIVSRDQARGAMNSAYDEADRLRAALSAAHDGMVKLTTALLEAARGPR